MATSPTATATATTKTGNDGPLVKLPYPFLTVYRTRHVPKKKGTEEWLNLAFVSQPAHGVSLPEPLHNDQLCWLALTRLPEPQLPPASDNSSWARARRCRGTVFAWTASQSSEAPSLGQIWNVVHAIFLSQPTFEPFRLELSGPGAATVRYELLATGLGISHPGARNSGQMVAAAAAKDSSSAAAASAAVADQEILILPSAFWQGAASPAGPRPIWAVGSGSDGPSRRALSQYPPMAENY